MSVSAVKSQAPWENHKKPFAERLHGAIDYLNFKVRNSNAVTAYQTIEKIVAEQRKYSFFKKFFPKNGNARGRACSKRVITKITPKESMNYSSW